MHHSTSLTKSTFVHLIFRTVLSPSFPHLKQCLASLELLYGLLDQRHLLMAFHKLFHLPILLFPLPSLACLIFLVWTGSLQERHSGHSGLGKTQLSFSSAAAFVHCCITNTASYHRYKCSISYLAKPKSW